MCDGRAVKRVTILSWDLCRNHFSKAFALAEALSAGLRGSAHRISFFRRTDLPAAQGSKAIFQTDYFDGADFPDFFAVMKKALDVIQGDIIYVVKPRLPSLGSCFVGKRAARRADRSRNKRLGDGGQFAESRGPACGGVL